MREMSDVGDHAHSPRARRGSGAQVRRHAHQHRRQGPLDRQRVHRAIVEERQIRRGVSARLWGWTRNAAAVVRLFHLLQRPTTSSGAWVLHAGFGVLSCCLSSEPNSFNGPKENNRYTDLPLHGDADRCQHRDGINDYTQVGNLLRLFNAAQKRRLFDNIAAAMQGVPDEIKRKQVALFTTSDPAYGAGLANAVKLDPPGDDRLQRQQRDAQAWIDTGRNLSLDLAIFQCLPQENY
jgi:hypothetical protein